MARALLLAVVLALLGAAGARAQDVPDAVPGVGNAPGQAPGSTTAPAPTDPNAVTLPPTDTEPPPGRRLSARDARTIADQQDAVREVRGEWVRRTAFLKGATSWQVSYYGRPDGDERTEPEVAQVLVDDRSSAVLEAWNGPQVAWTMARGYPGAFGRKVNAPWVWLALCVAFVLPFLRRPVRWLHADLAVVLAFSISYALFQDARIDLSVPLAYPLLVYLLVRMLLVARARGRPGAMVDRPPLALALSPSALGVGLIFLVGFRVGLNVTDSNVIDVGYAGVIGADRLVGGEPLYGGWPDDNPSGDTYGPAVYLPYVPFELVLPWRGTWDDLPAAHAAAVLFDLGTAGLLWWLGRRLRGPVLGLLLAWLWLACPWTLLVANSNSNDALVALTVVAALLALTAPVGRGALAAVAGLTKFAPLALAPLLATYRGGLRLGGPATQPVAGGAPEARGGRGRALVRPVAGTALGFLAASAVLLVPALLAGGDLGTAFDRTIGEQADRGSPFSIWGAHEGLAPVQRVVQGLTVVLALAAAVVPRRRDAVTVAALACAITVAVQLSLTHWFYLYLPWFLPLLYVTLLAPHREPEPAAASSG